MKIIKRIMFLMFIVISYIPALIFILFVDTTRFILIGKFGNAIESYLNMLDKIYDKHVEGNK